ncbi:MAG: dihydropteroate synthase [Actinobacteria bacterium]|nr:dihydropteroate synthase [Actinomycetota bacterium]
MVSGSVTGLFAGSGLVYDRAVHDGSADDRAVHDGSINAISESTRLHATLGGHRAIMGIINVTPDSFFPSSRYPEPGMAIERGMEMVAEGADILDIGGESTRPGASPVGEQEEMDRVLPVVGELAKHARISIDTRKDAVAREAVRAGASIINDVSGSLYPVAADHHAGWIAMHMKGDPQDMQESPTYSDVVAEVESFLLDVASRAVDAGVEEVWIDPGIGFGKTLVHNVELLRALPRLASHGFPVLVGTSRKSFLGVLGARHAGETLDPSMRLSGSLATAVWAFMTGTSVVRVHDVRATREALTLLEAVAAQSPGFPR